MSGLTFTIEKKLENKLGRAGLLTVPHGKVETPAFVAVGTKGTVKSLTPEQLEGLGSQIALANTYHLYLQPGDDLVSEAGGLHSFMKWNAPLMTDSGGFQVFSLGAAYGSRTGKIVSGKNELLLPSGMEGEDRRPRLVSIEDDGVMFRSHIDGSVHYFTPEKSVQIQHALGADIIFAFDECISPTEGIHYQREALDRTHRWARRCLDYHAQSGKRATQSLFGIVQGGRDEKLRRGSAKTIGDMDFDGFGIGGSFAREDMETAVRWTNELLPEEKPRHLLGIGEPGDLFMGVENGVDLFDCVAPTRIARTGTLYTKGGKINILNAKYTRDFSPVESTCGCETCRGYSRAYLSHLFRSKEILGMVLASIHNLFFITHLVSDMRTAILEGTFFEFKDSFLKDYGEI